MMDLQSQTRIEMFKAVIAFATLATKSLILVNGAAVIAFSQGFCLA